MVRLALLLLIAGGLAIFTLQNLTPIAIVILGVRTPALPLAIWVLGMLAAGSLTAVLLSGFSSLARAAGRRSTQPNQRDSAQYRTGSPQSPWSTAGARRDAASSADREADRRNPFAGAGNRRVDDWEASPSNDWDDWGEAPQQPASKTKIRDTADDDWARWNDETGASRRRTAEPSPRRASQSSTSSQPATDYSYREPQDTAGERRKNEVYDAEYRVLIPPYNPMPAPAPAPTPAPQPDPVKPEPAKRDEDEEDWI